jgi:hypothetical protein
MVGSFGHIFPVFFYFAVRTDPYSGSNNAHNDFAIHFLFTKGGVFCHHLFIRITQQGKWNVIFFNEFFMRGLIVRRDTQDNNVTFLEFAIQVTESLGFLGSAGSIVLGVKVNKYIFALEVLQCYLVSVRVRQCKRRRSLSDFDCHDNLPL